MLRKPRRDGRSADMLKTIGALLKKTSNVVIATDPGREGEGIARQILDHFKWSGKIERLMTSSLAPTHLNNAVKNLIDGEKTRGWGVSANFRSSMDWIEGINYSRFYGIKVGRPGEVISVGRVQSATLSLIVDRDREILNFKPEAFFELKISLNLKEGLLVLTHAPNEKSRIKDRAAAEKKAGESSHQIAELEVKSTPKTMGPPNPFSLPDLQITASAKWKWNASKTLQVLQNLYEAGRVTYPRTDSSHLNDEMTKEIPSILRQLARANAYSKIVPSRPVFRKTVFDSSKVGDHHAIIPTGEKVSGGSGADEEKLFDLITRRFLASIMDDAKGETTSIKGIFGGHEFKATGLVIKYAGWKSAYDFSVKEDEEASLPPIENGKKVKSREVEILERSTKPPAHYTDGTLIKAMVAVGSKNPDAEIRDLMSQGIGTQATRHTIIDTLRGRLYVVDKDRKIISTIRGREFIDILRADSNLIADPLATANMEKKLNEIEKDPDAARQVWKDFVLAFQNQFRTINQTQKKRFLTPVAQDEILNSAPPMARKAGSNTYNKGAKGKAPAARSTSAPARKPRKAPAKFKRTAKAKTK
jgi:DNA topoisomerase-3